MVLEHEIPKFIDWLPFALIKFLLAVALVSVLGCLFGFIRKSVQLGPGEGFYSVAKVLADGVVDVGNFSLRRALAVARLAVQESIRRRIIIVVAVFVIVLLFAGWFLDVKSDHPGMIYISFVLTATTYLILPLSLFLAAFSLPNEIKNRIIYTVVTKPVRPLELVVGRIAGFAFVGTVILTLMCLVSYFFVTRGLHHTHSIVPGSIVADGNNTKATTTQDAHHRHEITIGPDGNGQTDIQLDHYHDVRRIGEQERAEYVIGPPKGALQARVPVYGKLKYYDRDGKEGQGINVGNEWMYRSYIEGGTLASAVWTFSGISEKEFPQGLPLELTLSVFRTHKGNIERGVAGTMKIRNPGAQSGALIRESAEFNFISKEFVTDQQFIPKELKARDKDGTLRDVDLFKDLVTNGQVEIEIRCLDRGQYFGMAQADVYLRAADRPFFWNFVKGYLGIWMQMVLVTSFAVLFSTFLNGAVAMMATIGTVVLGYFGGFLAELLNGTQVGGGATEAFIRLLTQGSISVDLEFPPIINKTIRVIDMGLLGLMGAFGYLLPDYSQFDTISNVAHGYDIQPDLLGAQFCSTLAYLMVVSAVAYFCFKTREIAA